MIGGGQAGLATSHELTQAGVEHVILERARVGETWRKRWDSFCLVTPNWSVRLPGGGAYSGDDPDGFMLRDEIVEHLERYAAGFDAPLREGVHVSSLEAAPEGGYLVRTSAGDIRAEVGANLGREFGGVACRIGGGCRHRITGSGGWWSHATWTFSVNGKGYIALTVRGHVGETQE